MGEGGYLSLLLSLVLLSPVIFFRSPGARWLLPEI